MAAPADKPVIPTLTGNPVIDSMIGAALVSASTALATVCVTWMNSHGFQGADQTQIFGAIFGILGLISTVIWRWVQTRKIQPAVADHVITAAATGVIPDSVMKEAVKAPSISETKIEQAVSNTAVIKENQ